jgi:hypothetical protein
MTFMFILCGLALAGTFLFLVVPTFVIGVRERDSELVLGSIGLTVIMGLCLMSILGVIL